MAGTVGVLAVVVARKIAEGAPRRGQKCPPVCEQILIVGKAVVQHILAQKISGVELVPQAVVHRMVVQQRVQMGRAAQDAAVFRCGGIGGRCVGKGVIAAAGQRQAAVGHGGVQRVQQVGVVQIICITEGEPPRTQRAALPQPGRAGGRYTAVGLVQRHKTLVPGCDGIAERRGTVCGTIVHQNAPETVKFLRSNRIGAGGQIGCCIIDRHNDRDLTGLHFVTSA